MMEPSVVLLARIADTNQSTPDLRGPAGIARLGPPVEIRCGGIEVGRTVR